jgi:signal transduction histidine kinase
MAALPAHSAGDFMGQSKSEIADGRAHTDASLDAERARSDLESAMCAADARRVLDDLVERDRQLADIKLFKFRVVADSSLSRERSHDPFPDSSVAHERESADQRTQLERAQTDALRQRERLRSDIAVEAGRIEQDAVHLGLQPRRQATDDQLSMERRGADTTSAALGATRHVLGTVRGALAEEQTKGGRQHDVLGTVAHELRNPLTVICLSAASISLATHDASILADLRAMELATARMERLLGDLTDVARIDSGTLRIVKRPHDIGALLREVLCSYEPLFSSRSIKFSIKVSTEGIHASFDHDRIVQVLSNLLGNAMKFTQGGGVVALEVEREADMVVFTVRDNGPGIPQAALAHVFERFWQLESEGPRGLGLGLHICENLVQAHGGRMTVASELGKGTTFGFALPLNSAQTACEAEA